MDLTDINNEKKKKKKSVYFQTVEQNIEMGYNLQG